MRDPLGREVNYLRLSVTEACNFRCAYCVPNGHGLSHAPALTLPAIERLVRAAVSLDICRIRLTGGEPLVRRDILNIVRTITAVEGVQDLSLTTNAFLLDRFAAPLAAAGLRRVNISLDTLNRNQFARLVGRDALDEVWRGIYAAEAAGLTPLKINVVALRGVNEDEVTDFARMTIEHPWHVRFIELMPIGDSETGRAFYSRHFIPAGELLARMEGYEPIAGPNGNGPARTYRLPGARGTIGVITPASQHFCSACNRIRVTARGIARPCLFGSQEIDLAPALNSGDEQSIRELLAQAVAAKPREHPWGDSFTILKQGMAEIGG